MKRKHIVIGAVAVFVILAAIGGASNSGTVAADPVTTPAPVAASTPAPVATPEPVVEVTPAPVVEAEPEYTVAQENAIESAQSYLDLSWFSRSGLIDQLVFEGFTKAQAKHAVDQVGL